MMLRTRWRERSTWMGLFLAALMSLLSKSHRALTICVDTSSKVSTPVAMTVFFHNYQYLIVCLPSVDLLLLRDYAVIEIWSFGQFLSAML